MTLHPQPCGKHEYIELVCPDCGLRFDDELGYALAAAARQGGDVKQAPGEAPQSGPPKEGNAQRRKP